MVFHPAQKGFSQSTINVTTAGTITSRKRKSARSASTPGVMHWSIFANSGTLIVSEDVVVSVCTSFWKVSPRYGRMTTSPKRFMAYSSRVSWLSITARSSSRGLASSALISGFISFAIA